VSVRQWNAVFGSLALLFIGCNSNTPEPASVDLVSVGARLTIVRTATDPFLQRFKLTMHVKGSGGCSASTELFPDTGYASRRNVYQAAGGRVYVVGQYDARIIDSQNCQTSLSEFRHLDRNVVFIGSFDTDEARRWTFFPAAHRPELPFEKR
jgi:hypothetical protein